MNSKSKIILAAGQHRIGHLAHQADSPAAIDQANTVPCKLSAQLPRRLGVARIPAERRSAVDADRSD